MNQHPQIAVLGAGAWGTAIAICASQNAQQVLLFERNLEKVAAINTHHQHPTSLGGMQLPNNIVAIGDLHSLAPIKCIAIAVPVQQVRIVMAQLAKVQFTSPLTFVICCKGIEANSNKLCSEIISEYFPEAIIAVLSGPNFAQELANGAYSSANIACADLQLAKELVAPFSTPTFHIAPLNDVVGLQIAGAFKNVIAIAAGIVLGLGWQENARAALIAQGVVEMANLCIAMGGQAITLLSAAGIGDLFLTCTSHTSRNTEFGFQLGQGANLDDLLKAKTTVEGYNTTLACWQLCRKFNLDMPLVQAAYDVLYQNAAPNACFETLSKRAAA